MPLTRHVAEKRSSGRSKPILRGSGHCSLFFRPLRAPQHPRGLPGVSLAPVLVDVSQPVRTSALTQYATGYSLRTERYRYTEWGPDGSTGAELYDRDSDPEELVNLANSDRSEAPRVRLSKMLRMRIAKAKKKPAGLTQIQFKNRRRVK